MRDKVYYMTFSNSCYLYLVDANVNVYSYWDLVWSAPTSTGTTGIFDV